MMKSKHVLFAVILFSIEMLNVAFQLLALLAPRYIRKDIPIIGGASILLSVSLFTVNVHSDCVTPFSNSPYRIPYNLPKYTEDMCRALVSNLNGKSIRQTSNILCRWAVQTGNYEIGCDEFSKLYAASLILIIILSTSIAVSLILCISIMLYFSFRRKNPFLSNLITWLQFAIFTIQCLGIVYYVFIGGQLDFDPLLFSFEGHEESTVQFYDIGAVVYLLTTVWAFFTLIISKYTLSRHKFEPEDIEKTPLVWHDFSAL